MFHVNLIPIRIYICSINIKLCAISQSCYILTQDFIKLFLPSYNVKQNFNNVMLITIMVCLILSLHFAKLSCINRNYADLIMLYNVIYYQWNPSHASHCFLNLLNGTMLLEWAANLMPCVIYFHYSSGALKTFLLLWNV